MRLNKDDIYSLIGTVAFHGVILLILWFTVLKTEVPDEDGGVLVNFGNVNAAAGMFEPKYTGQEPPQETTTPPPPVPEPQVETPKQRSPSGVRKVRATQSTILLNGKLSVRVE